MRRHRTHPCRGGSAAGLAALSYLGLGTQPPQPSWGRMLNEAQTQLFQAPMLAVYPGVAIALAVLGLAAAGVLPPFWLVGALAWLSHIVVDWGFANGLRTADGYRRSIG